MKSTVEMIEPTRAKLDVQVPVEELKDAMDKAYKDIAGQVNIPGFRRGKVPARIIDQRFGRGAVIEQAINAEMDNFYRQAMMDNDLQPMSRPEVEVTEVPAVEGPLAGELKFTVEVEVRPEITIPDLSEVSLTVDPVEVSDEDVEKNLDSLRQRFGTLVGVDRAAAEGDFAVIDMTAVIDGEEVDSVSGISYEIGSAMMLDGMDEALTGLSANESATFTTELVGGEHAGEEAEVTVTPTAIKERELPEADDDFAQLASEFDTIDELRADLRKDTEKDKRAGQAVQARDALLDYLRENVEFPVSERVVDEEINAQIQASGTDPESDEGKEQREKMREDMTSALRDQLLLDALVSQTSVNVSQDELLNFIVEQAQMNGIDPNQFIQAAVQSGQLGAFHMEIARNKALVQSLREVSVTDGTNDVDLTEFIGEQSPADEPLATVPVDEDTDADAENADAEDETETK